MTIYTDTIRSDTGVGTGRGTYVGTKEYTYIVVRNRGRLSSWKHIKNYDAEEFKVLRIMWPKAEYMHFLKYSWALVRGHINPYEHRTTSYFAISHVFSRAVAGN